MADISVEIMAFRDAVKGEEVRGSMISLAQKVNADGENALTEVAAQVTRIDGIATQALQLLEDANTAIETANEAIDTAENTLEEGAQQVQQAAGSAKLAESWTKGLTGVRPGENTNNSKYFSTKSKAEADRAKEEADRAQQYAGITIPNIYINFESRDLEYTSADDIVYYEDTGSSYIAKNNIINSTTPPPDDPTHWQIHARGFKADALWDISAADSNGVLGTPGAMVSSQILIDAIASKVMGDLIPYMNIANNLLSTDPNTVLSGPMGKSLKELYDALNSNLERILTDENKGLGSQRRFCLCAGKYAGGF